MLGIDSRVVYCWIFDLAYFSVSVIDLSESVILQQTASMTGYSCQCFLQRYKYFTLPHSVTYVS